MKNACIIHGCGSEEEFLNDDIPSPSNHHWIPWLQKQLLMRGYLCQTPEMPAPYQPDYEEWKKVMKGFLVNRETSLVAHSCGSGFLLRWLGENTKKIQRLVMVAPSLDLKRRRGEFMNFTLAPDLQDRIGEIHVFLSADEPVPGIRESVDAILKTYPKSRLHNFDKMGHFCRDSMGTEKFPELLDIFLKEAKHGPSRNPGPRLL